MKIPTNKEIRSGCKIFVRKKYNDLGKETQEVLKATKFDEECLKALWSAQYYREKLLEVLKAVRKGLYCKK